MITTGSRYCPPVVEALSSVIRARREYPCSIEDRIPNRLCISSIKALDETLAPRFRPNIPFCRPNAKSPKSRSRISQRGYSPKKVVDHKQLTFSTRQSLQTATAHVQLRRRQGSSGPRSVSVESQTRWKGSSAINLGARR